MAQRNFTELQTDISRVSTLVYHDNYPLNKIFFPDAIDEAYSLMSYSGTGYTGSQSYISLDTLNKKVIIGENNISTEFNSSLLKFNTGSKIIVKDNKNNALSIGLANDDFIIVDTSSDKITVNKMMDCTGLSVDNNLFVGGAALFDGATLFNGIVNFTSTINSSSNGNGCLVLNGGQYIAKDLHMAGTAYKPVSQFWEQSSDKRIKTDIIDADINECIDSVMKIKIKKYKYTDKFKEAYEYTEDRHHAGVIADELMETHPHAVKLANNEKLGLRNFKTVNLGEPTYELFAVVQHLVKKVNDLQSQIDELRK
jgi:hypothetical protein